MLKTSTFKVCTHVLVDPNMAVPALVNLVLLSLIFIVAVTSPVPDRCISPCVLLTKLEHLSTSSVNVDTALDPCGLIHDGSITESQFIRLNIQEFSSNGQTRDQEVCVAVPIFLNIVVPAPVDVRMPGSVAVKMFSNITNHPVHITKPIPFLVKVLMLRNM